LPGECQRQWSIDQNGARYPPCAPCRRRDAGSSSRPAGSRAPGFYRSSELRRDIRRVDGVCTNWRVRGDDGNHAEQRRRRRRAPDAHSRPRPLLCVGLRYARMNAQPSPSRRSERGALREVGSGGPIWDLFSTANSANSARLSQSESAYADAQCGRAQMLSARVRCIGVLAGDLLRSELECVDLAHL
jgi:hypothetical protein